MTLDGIPAGLPVDFQALEAFLSRRAPGNAPWATTRQEADKPEFLGGLLDGYTCGAPIAAVIYNTNIRSGDYEAWKHTPRPGHADYTAQAKYGGFQDTAGGGHFSGRLTAPLCIAGGLCKQWLEGMGIRIGACIVQVGKAKGASFDPMSPQLNRVGQIFPSLTAEDAEVFQRIIADAKANGDSVGGKIQCAVTGLPAGLGEPMFGGVESRIAQIVYGIPGVKSVGFGAGEAFAELYGSQSNDAYVMEAGEIRTATNRCGGILGGITNGMSLLFDVTMKPTPSIGMRQQTVNLQTGTEVPMEIHGRHDPCIVPRAVCVVEAAAAIALFDMVLGNTQTPRRN
jgi:chorismate synthase